MTNSAAANLRAMENVNLQLSQKKTEELSQKKTDIKMMLAANVHLGHRYCDPQMERNVFKRSPDDWNQNCIINLGKTWEKLHLAGRVIVAIENLQDMIVMSARVYGHTPVEKFSQYTGASEIAGKYTPGTFTNHLHTTSFIQPRLLTLADARTDRLLIKEASLGDNIPTIAFYDIGLGSVSDSPMHHLYIGIPKGRGSSPLRNVDIVIPANNNGRNSIGLLFWLLTRMVLQMRGTVLPGQKLDMKADEYEFLYMDLSG